MVEAGLWMSPPSEILQNFIGRFAKKKLEL